MAAHLVGLVILAAEFAVFSRRHLRGILRNAEAELLGEGVGFGEDVVAYLLCEFRNTAVDCAELGLLLFVKAYALALEALETLFQHDLLLAREAALVAVVDRGYPFVEVPVERDVVGVLAEHGDCLRHHRIEGIAAVGLADIIEHAEHLVEYLAREFERHYGVLEGRSVGIGGDFLDLGVLLFDSGLYRRYIVFDFNLVVGRDTVRGVPLGEEGILFAAGCHNGCDCQ